MTTTDQMSQRVYFIDGPARGQSMLRGRWPSRLNWDDAQGNGHEYQRVTRFRSAYFYRLAG